MEMRGKKREYDNEKEYGVGDERADMESLRQINNMMYLRPSQASLTCKRQVKIQPFQTVSASMGDTLQVIVNSGDEFLYGPSSVLKLQYRLDIGAAGRTLQDFWGQNGSILNIFKSIRLTHRSGQQLEYIDEVGTYATIKRLYNYSETGRRALDSLLNFNPVLDLTAAQFPPVGGATSSATIVSMIPLSLLCGVFDSVEILPPQLVAGLKIELQLKTNAQSTQFNADSIGDLSIRPSLLMDCITAYDSVVREIVEQTADTGASGIQYTYETGFYTTGSVNADGAVLSLDIQNSVSIASKAFFVMTAPANDILDTKPKMGFYPNVSALQWRAGAEYFPNQQIISVNASSGVAYSNIINQTEQIKDNLIAQMSYPHQFGSPQILGSTVSLSSANGNPEPYNFYNLIAANQQVQAPTGADGTATSAVYGQTLDRSPAGIAGKYSGLQTNNARLLNVSATVISGLTGRMKCWMMSTRVVNLAGDTAVVDR